MICSFAEDLEFSLGGRMQTDMEILKNTIMKCISVKKTKPEEDKNGVDYIVTLEGGAQIRVDAKRRKKGASNWWPDGEPRLAIETWSVIRPDGYRKVGWTFDTEKECDLILYVFDPADTDKYYLIPFPLLRQASYKLRYIWSAKYKRRRQQSDGWQSEHMTIPASVVIEAVKNEMTACVVGAKEVGSA